MDADPQTITVVSEDGEPVRAAFPIHTRIGETAAVIVALDDYKALLAAKVHSGFEGPVKALRAITRPVLKPLPSTIERDPDVAGFLRQCFARADTIAAAHAACEGRFGAERTPSQSRINSFRMKVRRGA